MTRAQVRVQLAQAERDSDMTNGESGLWEKATRERRGHAAGAAQGVAPGDVAE